MKLFIDNKEVDLSADNEALWSLSIDNIRSLDPKTATIVQRLKLPSTKRNRMVMGYCDQLFVADNFNHTKHHGRLEVDGVDLLEGLLVMVAYEGHVTLDGEYTVELRDSRKEWAERAYKALMKDMPIEYENTLTSSNVAASWSPDNDVPFRFFPVQRDRYSFQFDIQQGVPSRVFTISDYHPFLSIHAAMTAMAAAAGYTINSQFVNAGFFKSLYMSGNYPTTDIDLIQTRNAFLAGRVTTAATTVSPEGIVFANPSRIGGSNVGNIFESANSLDNPKFFVTNNGIQKIGDKMVFVPNEPCILGFEYDLKFTCQTSMLSATSLGGVNRVKLDDNVVYDFDIPNTKPDYKQSTHIKGNMVLRSDHISDGQTIVQLVLQYELNQGMNEFETITIRSAITPINRDYYIKSVVLKYRPLGTSDYQEYPYDHRWALHMTDELSGQTTVHIKLRSSPQLRTVGRPIYFDMITFYGGVAGTGFTLSPETIVKPLFWSYPGKDDTVTTERLMAHDRVYQIKLFDAVRQMFNLYFYTNPITKQIFIEPRDKFYTDKTIDWRRKHDTSKPIVVEHPGEKLYSTVTMIYRDGDGSVARYNRKNRTEYARYRYLINTHAAKDEEKIDTNPLFTPTMGNASVLTTAQSAYVIHVGDRLAQDQPNDSNLEFPPKIVRYMGLRQLAADEQWTWPAPISSYPFLAFHYKGVAGWERDPNYNSVEVTDIQTIAQNGMTLCFDDSEHQKGLHQFYDSTLGAADTGRKIYAYMDLSAVDIARLLNPDSAGADFRAKYILSVSGENVTCRLLELRNYDPINKKSTECVFLVQ